jgi:single-stranded-DNA-specific exonuclease
MRLRLRQGHHCLNAIGFSITPESASIEPGDAVDIAFQPQINEFRGERSVQLNIIDIRPHCNAKAGTEYGGYRRLHNDNISAEEAAALLPDRSTLAMVWRYLAGCGGDSIREAPACLCRKIVRRSGLDLELGQLMVCLDIFEDVGLLQIQRQAKHLVIRVSAPGQKADLQQSTTMQHLLRVKGS